MIQSPTLLPDTLLARRLRVKVDWLRAEAAAGRLPHVKAGERYLFSPAAVERVLLERAQGKASGEGQPCPLCGKQ